MSVKRIMMGAAMMSSVRILRLLSQFLVVPILSRLLSPAEYGLVAIAMPFAMFAMVIADAGIGMSLVRTPAEERTTWSTCFWLTTAMGAVLGLIMAGLGPVAAYVFNEPPLTLMLAALGCAVFMQALHLIPVASLQQEQKFHTIAIIDIVSTSSGLASAVAMAYHGFGAWSLIGQQVIYFVIKVALTLSLSSFRPLRVFDWRETRDHIRFGGNVLGSNLVIYSARAFDNWIVGKVLGTAILGFYSMAFQFARLPQMIVTGPLQFVMYSQLVKMKDNPTAIARLHLVMTRLLAMLFFPAIGLLCAAHAPVFSFLLSAKWETAGQMYRIVAPACVFQAVVSISEAVMMSLNRADIQFRASRECWGMWVVVLFIAVDHGLTAAALAYTVAISLYQLRYLGMVLPLIGCSKKEYAAGFIIPLISTAFAVIAYLLVAPLLPEEPYIHALGAGFIALLTIALSGLSQRKGLMAEMRSWNAKPTASGQPTTELDTGIAQE